MSDYLAFMGGYAPWHDLNVIRVLVDDGVTSIGGWAFSICSSLESISVDTDNPAYASDNGVLFNKDFSTIIQVPTAKGPAGIHLCHFGIIIVYKNSDSQRNRTEQHQYSHQDNACGQFCPFRHFFSFHNLPNHMVLPIL